MNFEKVENKKADQTSTDYKAPLVFKTKKKVSFIKIIVPKRIIPGNAPAGEGKLAWVFVDEIVVK